MGMLMCQRMSPRQSAKRTRQKPATSHRRSKALKIISRRIDLPNHQVAGRLCETYGTTARVRLVEGMRMNSMRDVPAAILCPWLMKKPRSIRRERMGVGQVGSKEERKSQRESFAISARKLKPKLKPVTTTTTTATTTATT